MKKIKRLALLALLPLIMACGDPNDLGNIYIQFECQKNGMIAKGGAYLYDFLEIRKLIPECQIK